MDWHERNSSRNVISSKMQNSQNSSIDRQLSDALDSVQNSEHSANNGESTKSDAARENPGLSFASSKSDENHATELQASIRHTAIKRAAKGSSNMSLKLARRTPTTSWEGPDFKFNLESLGIDSQLMPWIESVELKPLMLSMPVETDQLQEHCRNLKDLDAEILEKFFTALTKIPQPMLKKFPHFDAEAFDQLKILHKHVKAKIRLTQTKISRAEKSEARCSSNNKAPNESMKIQRGKLSENSTRGDFVRDSGEKESPSNTERGTFQSKRPVMATKISSKITNKTAEIVERNHATKTSHLEKNVKEASLSLPKFTATKNAIDINENEMMPKEPHRFPVKSSNPSKSSESADLWGGDFELLTPISQKIEPPLSLEWPASSQETRLKSVEQNFQIGQFIGNYKNDGISGDFEGTDYDHSTEMLKIFRLTFHHDSFRPNQLPAINAALLGYDCFILMSTGGGKSLCYELPALVTSGLTIVVSPLKSLILDQVQKLTSLGISAAHMLAKGKNLRKNPKKNSSQAVFRELSEENPGLRLLYVTPEKLGASKKLRECLEKLDERSLLARFVIDEAHCVTQWGHDFRPAYKALKDLRKNHPQVPLMAVTATATPRSRSDIVHQLGMKTPKWFMSSFNRPNLRYSVIPKKAGQNGMDETIGMIQKKWENDCGIVYCFSRDNCDHYAAKLQSKGLKALAYHAGMSDDERSKVQARWTADKTKIVCATIAFGMGIDKPNVRFVIHSSIPKSIESYYQETGRAGRDGDQAECVLFYKYSDVRRWRKLIRVGKGATRETIKTHEDSLTKMTLFAENQIDCRRKQQLDHLGEEFDPTKCIANEATACDNCRRKDDFDEIDVTRDAKDIIRAVGNINKARSCGLTVLYLCQIFKGSNLRKIRDANLTTSPIYGRGRSWTESDIKRLLHKLILEEYLKEKMYSRNNFSCGYVKIGPKGYNFVASKISKMMFPMRSSAASAVATSAVATPVNKALKSEKVVLLNEDDDFEEEKRAAPSRKRRGGYTRENGAKRYKRGNSSGACSTSRGRTADRTAGAEESSSRDRTRPELSSHRPPRRRDHNRWTED